MSTDYASEADKHREKAKQADQEAFDSFERCDTDGFLSQWASRITADKHRLAAQIAERGGTWQFPALFDLEGRPVNAKLIDGRYGRCWALMEGETNGPFTGEFVTAFPKRPSTMTKKGFFEGEVVREAYADIRGSGTGLSGNAWAQVVAPVMGVDGILEVLENGQD